MPNANYGDLYEGPDKMEKERVENYVDFGPGTYNATLGKIYKDITKNGANRIVADFILLSFRAFEQSDDVPATPILRIKKNEGTTVLSLETLKTSDGKEMLFGIVKLATFPDIIPTMKPGAKRFFSLQRRQFAKAFDCFDEEAVDWEKLRSKVGSVFTFDMISSEDKKWINIQYDSISVMPAYTVSVASIKDIYDRISASKSKPEGSDDDAPPF